MKKILFCLGLSILIITGCEQKKEENKKEEIKQEEKQQVNEEPKLKEGKYIQIAPSNEGSQGEGYDSFLTVENGKATIFDTYFEATTEGTYTLNGTTITFHYTKHSGKTTYSDEIYEDIIDRTIVAHFDDNKIIYDSYSDFDAYEPGTIIFELK